MIMQENNTPEEKQAVDLCNRHNANGSDVSVVFGAPLPRRRAPLREIVPAPERNPASLFEHLTTTWDDGSSIADTDSTDTSFVQRQHEKPSLYIQGRDLEAMGYGSRYAIDEKGARDGAKREDVRRHYRNFAFAPINSQLMKDTTTSQSLSPSHHQPLSSSSDSYHSKSESYQNTDSQRDSAGTVVRHCSGQSLLDHNAQPVHTALHGNASTQGHTDVAGMSVSDRSLQKFAQKYGISLEPTAAISESTSIDEMSDATSPSKSSPSTPPKPSCQPGSNKQQVSVTSAAPRASVRQCSTAASSRLPHDVASIRPGSVARLRDRLAVSSGQVSAGLPCGAKAAANIEVNAGAQHWGSLSSFGSGLGSLANMQKKWNIKVSNTTPATVNEDEVDDFLPGAADPAIAPSETHPTLGLHSRDKSTLNATSKFFPNQRPLPQLPEVESVHPKFRLLYDSVRRINHDFSVLQLRNEAAKDRELDALATVQALENAIQDQEMLVNIKDNELAEVQWKLASLRARTESPSPPREGKGKA